MTCRYHKWLLQVLVIATGTCSSLFLGGCLRPLREPQKLPMAAMIGAPSKAVGRFADTVRVSLASPPAPPEVISVRESRAIQSNDPVDSAVVWCQKGLQQRAVDVLLSVVEHSINQDSLYWEALFQLGECYAIGGEYRRAALLLGEVAYRWQDVPSDIHQRAIVRLGHVFCLLGEFQNAERLFAELIHRYPQSVYRPVASCQVIR